MCPWSARPQGIELSSACLLRAAPDVRKQRVQYQRTRTHPSATCGGAQGLRRRARPSVHCITAAPAPAFHVPMVSAREVLNYKYTYECWRAAAGIARRELLTCGTGPATSVCCQHWLGGLRSDVLWSIGDHPPATSPLHAAGRGARHDGIRGRAGNMTGWMTGRDRCLRFVGVRARTPTKQDIFLIRRARCPATAFLTLATSLCAVCARLSSSSARPLSRLATRVFRLCTFSAKCARLCSSRASCCSRTADEHARTL
jgi:hypothetical protein